MPVNSRAKGARFERELAAQFRAYGYDTRRTAQYCGNTGEAADIVGLPHIHVEAKHVEQARFYDFIEQAVRDSQKSGRLPAVFYRKNGQKTLVVMQLDDWMSMYHAYQKEMGEE